MTLINSFYIIELFFILTNAFLIGSCFTGFSQSTISVTTNYLMSTGTGFGIPFIGLTTTVVLICVGINKNKVSYDEEEGN